MSSAPGTPWSPPRIRGTVDPSRGLGSPRSSGWPDRRLPRCRPDRSTVRTPPPWPRLRRVPPSPGPPRRRTRARSRPPPPRARSRSSPRRCPRRPRPRRTCPPRPCPRRTRPRPTCPRPTCRAPGVDPDVAEEFVRLFHTENPAAGPAEPRVAAVREEIARTGTYVHTHAELEFGARIAWRNSARCIGRLYWRSLHLRDRRHVTAPDEVAQECVGHLRDATRRGRIRSTITIFAPDGPAGPGPRVWNEQLDPLRRLPRRRPGARRPALRRLHRHRALAGVAAAEPDGALRRPPARGQWRW